MKNKKAFTLIELIIVIAIIALLAVSAFVVIDPVKRLREAKDSVRLQDALSIEDAIGLYLADNEGVLPAELSGLATSTEYVVVTGSGSSGSNTTSLQFLVDGGYLPEIPSDPDREK